MNIGSLRIGVPASHGTDARPAGDASSLQRWLPSTGLRPRPIVPQTLEQALQLGQAVVAARLAPRGMETPEACMIAILHGLEVGLSPMQALQRIAVVNGRPTIWGDGALALVQASGLADEILERVEGDGPQNWVGVCEVLRRGSSLPVIRRFSVEDARRAQLWGKAGPWSEYPLRMLQMRARAFALRDTFADVLGGLYLREEIEDVGQDAPHAHRSQEELLLNAGASGGAGAAETSGLPNQTPSELVPERRDPTSTPVTAGGRRSAYATGPRQKAPPPPADLAPAGDQLPVARGRENAAEKPAMAGSPAQETEDTPPSGAGQTRDPDGLPRAERRRRSAPRDGVSLRYANHWSIRRPRTMPPEPAYRKRARRGIPTPSPQVPQARTSQENSGTEVLSASQVLGLYDDALCCAFDQATMAEIVEEFAQRLEALDRDHRGQASLITRRHEQRIVQLENPTSAEVGGHA